MTWRPTPLVATLLTVVAWAACLAVLTARAELFFVALPLVAVLVTLNRRATLPECSVSLDVSADRVFEGETVTVTMSVQATSAVPLLVVRGPLPADTDLVSGRHRAAAAIGRGEATTWRYEVRCAARGAHDFGTVIVQARDRWGLRAWERRHVAPRPVHVYPRIAPLRSLPRPAHTQTSIGDYVSPALGEGIEPGDIREFAPGDRIRQVNWRASLRLGSLHVTQRRRERNADVVLMIDTLAAVGPRHDTTLDLGVRAAASLATAYLARKDRVGLINYGGTIDWVKPGSGRLQYERVADTLLKATVVFTYVTKDLGFVPPRVLPSHAIVIAVTPLLDPRFAKAALDLAARGFDVVVLAVSPVAVTRAMLTTSALNALACRLWTLERRAALDTFRRHGLTVCEWDPSEPLERALAGVERRGMRMVAG